MWWRNKDEKRAGEKMLLIKYQIYHENHQNEEPENVGENLHMHCCVFVCEWGRTNSLSMDNGELLLFFDEAKENIQR